MTSPLAAQHVAPLLGSQQPRISLVPEYVSSAGQEAIEVAEVAGLFLDPWEQNVLTGALGETAEGRWAAYRVGISAPRQNGKDAILEARELAGLFALRRSWPPWCRRWPRSPSPAIRSCGLPAQRWISRSTITVSNSRGSGLTRSLVLSVFRISTGALRGTIPARSNLRFSMILPYGRRLIRGWESESRRSM
jgi:hypothetical protein